MENNYSDFRIFFDKMFFYSTSVGFPRVSRMFTQAQSEVWDLHDINRLNHIHSKSTMCIFLVHVPAHRSFVFVFVISHQDATTSSSSQWCFWMMSSVPPLKPQDSILVFNIQFNFLIKLHPTYSFVGLNSETSLHLALLVPLSQYLFKCPE